MDFFELIGSDKGVIMFFTPLQLDGSYYTEGVLKIIKEASLQKNVGSPLANKNGIYTNSSDGKVDFYRKLKTFILPTKDSYDFKLRVFLNETLTEKDAVQFIINGNISELVADKKTIELTVENDSAGFLSKLIG